MNSPFIKYYKTILSGQYKEVSNRNILSEFNYRFKKSYGDHIEIKNDNELYVKNEIVRITPDLNINFWTGVGKAEIRISEFNEKSERLIEYKFYLTRVFLVLFLFLGVLLISVFSMDMDMDSRILVLKILGSIIIIFYSILISIILLRHKMVFNEVIRSIKTDFNSPS